MKIRELYGKVNLEQQDRMMAAQTARIMNMINLRGKEMVLKDDVNPDSCLAFKWGGKKTVPLATEITEEDMENFDRCMETHRGNHNG